ncbi:peptidoglycan DD-metalloendopeptidase family protein [Amnibacterium soli]|uniref:Peptidoglycan DD-metalloendopeptidase family protein n=1 Tax=Amnibacterium soli TaxID=1282736 RepID=A0ABP8Z7Z1_9MICO
MCTLSSLSHQQRRAYTRRGLLALGAAGVVTAVAVPMSAEAAGYPSWKDVLAARGNVKKKREEIATLQGLLAKSQAAAERAQKIAEQRGTEYQAAQARVESADQHLRTIEKQVAADEERAAQAKQRAGQLAAQLSRTGGADVETSLLLSGTDASASDFLARLGRLSKLTESNGAIADEAAAAKNAAAATQAQMQEVKDQLVGLKEKARIALQAAVQASEQANAQVQREQAQQVELQARLDALQATSDSVARRFQAGVAARKAAQTSAGGAASVNGAGWSRPCGPGPITGVFGPRPDQPAGANLFHRGTDIAAGFGTPIYAAHAGTVSYAGWFGTYGYWIEIDDGDGIQTGYAHIRPGGIFVRVGQRVSAGQNIASVGSTGAATGPHLHFEVRLHEVAVNAQPFMAARGIVLGG